MSIQQDPQFDKLRRLLAVKRHERPPSDYFENFLGEFHRRQRAEPLHHAGWWEQLREFFRAEPLLAARYALGSAIAVLLCVNIYYMTHPSPIRGGSEMAAIKPATNFALNLPEFVPMPPPRHFAPQVVSNDSKYVLDPIRITPANFEPAGEF